MNKRYIDFVPAREPEIKGVAKKSVPEPEVDVRQVMRERREPGVSTGYSRKLVTQRAMPGARGVSGEEPKYGVIEDYRPKFVQTEVKKRPLSGAQGAGKHGQTMQRAMGAVPKKGATPVPRRGDVRDAEDALIDAKRKKIAGAAAALESAMQKAEEIGQERKSVRESRREARKAAKLPKTPFVNTDKIDKRPLSKNVYKRKVVVPKEEPSGPVTIIEKPEKDSKVGMIVAIILTIILGAAAGTVAFLLLPK